MKIRQGFISNSSTTSFCLYGAYFSNTDEISDKISEAVKQGFKDYSEPHDNGVYVGIPLRTIKDDETFGQFKEKVAEKIKAIFGNNITTGIQEDGWYDG